MPLLADVVITVARASYNSGTGVTGASYPTHLTCDAQIEPTNMIRYASFGEAALSSDYTLHVDSGEDIAEGDRITNIVTIFDGSPYPSDIPCNSGVETWLIKKVAEDEPLFLPERLVFVARVKGQGKAHP